MASVVGIVNRALRELGASRINSLTDGTPNANIANDLYTEVRKAALRAHHWNFASELVKLAQLTSTPPFGFDNAYQLPSDNLRVMFVYDNDNADGAVKYRIHGDEIHSDADDLYLDYVKDVTDPNLMTADFREYLSLRIAVAMAWPVTQSNSVKEAAIKERDKAFRMAKGSDSIENYPDEQPDGSWVDSRSL